MQFVIVNADGELYGGFEEGKPLWRRAKRQEFLMDEALADKCLSQLQQLGFTNTAKRAENEIARKWVPKKTDAAAL